MKIAMAQINTTPGDVVGNVEKIKEFARKNPTADMVVYPEMAIPGYYPHDLVERPEFIAANEKALEILLDWSKTMKPALAIGVIGRNPGAGKSLRNGMVLIQNGKILFSAWKKLLPTYDVFDERRHYEPGVDGNVFQFMGRKIGFLICEDIWNDSYADYAVNPVADAVRDGAEIIVSLNSSPSDFGKMTQRLSLFAPMCKKYGIPLVYVNQVGGQEEVVFDGRSFVLDAEGNTVAGLAGFAEDTGDFVWNGAVVSSDCRHDSSMTKYEFAAKQIVLGVRDFLWKQGAKKVVVGCSGGVDSAAVIRIAVEALGAENVFAVTMPSRWSSDGSVSDSVILCENLGVKLFTHPIGDIAELFENGFVSSFGVIPSNDKPTLENHQARTRGIILMGFSNEFGAMVLSTGNKSEMSVGYATLYGDMNGAINPLGDLYKMEVYGLCRYFNERDGKDNIPVAILEKEPSAELRPGQKDSDSLPPYPVLDAILRKYVEGTKMEPLEKDETERILSEVPRDVVEKVVKMVDNAEFKRRQAPPIVRVHSKAFGFGRRIPIIKKITSFEDEK